MRLVGPLAPSDRLIELVEARLGNLDGAERALLELVSFGEPLGTAELLTLSNAALAEDLERKGLLLSRMDGRRLELRLAHSVYGDVLRSRIPALRVRALTRSLAEAVEATGGRRREDILRVATWQLTGAGGRPELMLAAASIARWRYDFPLAERLAKAALEAGAGFDAALLAAQLAGLQGRVTESEAALAALAALAASDAQRGPVAITRMDTYLYLGRFDESLQLAQQAEASIADPAWRDEITARQSALILATQGPEAAAKAVEPLLEHATGAARVWAHVIASATLDRLGRLDAAIDTADRGHAAQLSLTTPMPWYPWIHLYNRVLALAHAGRLEESEALTAGQYQQAIADSSIEAQAMFALNLAQLVETRGRIKTAAQHAREAVALSRQLGRPLVTRLGLQTLALALALGGEAEGAADALAALDALNLPPNLFALDLTQARAWTAVAAGDLPQACRLLADAATTGETIGELIGAASCLHGLARLGRAKDVASRLTALAAKIDGQLASARATHTQALASGDPSGLEKVSIDFEAMGADLLAAEAAADTAVAWQRAGDSRQSAYAERRAASLVDRCEGPATPALQAIKARAQLASAEREAGLLAAAGRSNKQIAEELGLSVRTVENRLQHVYEKLGIKGRAELAAALDRESGTTS
jgi:DNA-binding CsgD family transcriptional regulator